MGWGVYNASRGIGAWYGNDRRACAEGGQGAVLCWIQGGTTDRTVRGQQGVASARQGPCLETRKIVGVGQEPSSVTRRGQISVFLALRAMPALEMD